MISPFLSLHGYWRSTASYRVRIALNLKGLAYDQVTHDLRKGEHRNPAYGAIAPQGLVPAIEVGGLALTQSPALLEWIEERWPEPALLPKTADGRAIVRAMGALIACDIHPINNLRVLQALRSDFSAAEDQVRAWIFRWISDGFSALEILIAQHGHGFAFGESPTLADCYLVPQVYSAERFGIDLEPFPGLRAAARRAGRLPAFEAAHPRVQPDSDAN